LQPPQPPAPPQPPRLAAYLALQAALGKCNAVWLTSGNYCAASCGRPPCAPVQGLAAMVAPAAECVDIPPDSRLTCGQQREFGKCAALWMLQGGFCAKTCGLPPCADPEDEGAVLATASVPAATSSLD
jgi:hypothetical protein